MSAFTICMPNNWLCNLLVAFSGFDTEPYDYPTVPLIVSYLNPFNYPPLTYATTDIISHSTIPNMLRKLLSDQLFPGVTYSRTCSREMSLIVTTWEEIRKQKTFKSPINHLFELGLAFQSLQIVTFAPTVLSVQCSSKPF